MKKKEQAVWQRRFWEHLIRDDNDYLRHVEYIHYNPVKHGHAKAPGDWEYSSFHKYVRQGKYDNNWGVVLHFVTIRPYSPTKPKHMIRVCRVRVGA